MSFSLISLISIPKVDLKQLYEQDFLYHGQEFQGVHL